MSNAQQLASRFREVILNGTFIANTNYKAQLDGSSWELATTKISDLNTIAALAQHLHYYIAGVQQVFRGGVLDIHDKYSFDFPPITNQDQWDAFLELFWDDAETFALLVERLPEQRIGEAFVDEKYGSYLRNIDAMIEHSYYHLGQIVLIKKLLSGQQGA